MHLCVTLPGSQLDSRLPLTHSPAKSASSRIRRFAFCCDAAFKRQLQLLDCLPSELTWHQHKLVRSYADRSRGGIDCHFSFLGTHGRAGLAVKNSTFIYIHTHTYTARRRCHRWTYPRLWDIRVYLCVTVLTDNFFFLLKHSVPYTISRQIRQSSNVMHLTAC